MDHRFNRDRYERQIAESSGPVEAGDDEDTGD
jgi:hypothetical protein